MDEKRKTMLLRRSSGNQVSLKVMARSKGGGVRLLYSAFFLRGTRRGPGIRGMQQGPARLRCLRCPDVTLHGGTLRSQMSIKMDGVGGEGTRGAWDLQGEPLTGRQSDRGARWRGCVCAEGGMSTKSWESGAGACVGPSCSRSYAVRLHTGTQV